MVNIRDNGLRVLNLGSMVSDGLSLLDQVSLVLMQALKYVAHKNIFECFSNFPQCVGSMIILINDKNIIVKNYGEI